MGSSSQSFTHTALSSLFAGKQVLFLAHARSDMDTLASSYVLSLLFDSIAQTTAFGIPEKLPEHLEKRISFFSKQPAVIDSLASFDVIVGVDFRSPRQAGKLSDSLKHFSKKLVLFDHHSPSASEFDTTALSFIQKNAPATAQMVFLLGEEMSYSFSPIESKALAMALISDSARFNEGDEHTFRMMHVLLKNSGESYESILSQTESHTPLSDKVTVFKYLRNTHLWGIGPYLLASVNAPYQNAPSANALMQLGADVAIGYYPSPRGVFASLRFSPKIVTELHMSAAEMGLVLSREHDGQSGGHARVAQLSLPPYFSEHIITDFFLKEILKKVKKKEQKTRIIVY